MEELELQNKFCPPGIHKPKHAIFAFISNLDWVDTVHFSSEKAFLFEYLVALFEDQST